LRTTEYPQRFVAFIEDKIEGGVTDHYVSVFQRDSKSAPWLWERLLGHPSDGWPKFALDKAGYVRTDVQASKLLFDPTTAPTELATYVTMASPLATAANGDLFESSIGTDDYRADTRETLEEFGGDGYSTTFTATPSAAHEVLVFRLKDGSALVSFGLTSVTKVSHPDANPDQALEQDADRSAWDPRIAPGLYREWVANDLEDFTVLVPTKKSRDKATAITILYGPISVSGTPVADPSQYG
jgi:hypothetical protein